METLDDLRYRKLLLNNGSFMPALGFGTLIADLTDTEKAVSAAVEVGFRQFDCAERYRNENAIGEAIRGILKKGNVGREDLFIATKLWNTNHRPERVKTAFEGSLARLGLDYADLYLIHTPFAFKPGDNQDPRDERGNVLYDEGVTLLQTWQAMESLVDAGRCRAIGLSDISLAALREVADAARIKPAVVQVESHPYLPQPELLDYCQSHGMVVQAFAPLGHNMNPRLIDDPVITAIGRRVNKTPSQVLLAWAVQRGTAPLTTSTNPYHIKENFEISTLPEEAMEEINAGITTRYRFNVVVQTGVPGFIPEGR
jgi:diketogulonate reductase-like aldo/keto reductase